MLYIKALHIIFIVTWFSGLFYIVRLFIYNAEANEKAEPEKSILLNQFGVMIKRLWFGITWPSAILTLIFGLLTWFLFYNWFLPAWLMVKFCFVICLYLYHFSLHAIYKQQSKGIFKYSSQQLRVWNEVATIFLVAAIMLVIVKQDLLDNMNWLKTIGYFILFIITLMSSIRIYKMLRKSK